MLYCPYLRICGLSQDAGDGVGVTTERVDVHLGPHVPHPRRRVPAATEQDVQCGVERQVVDSAKVAVVVADDLVVLQVPALDLPVLAAGEEIRLATGDGQAAHHAHVSRQRQLEFPAGQIPDFDDAVRGASGKPLVARLNGAAANPAHVAGYDAVQLPGCVPRGLGHRGWPPDSQLAASSTAHCRLHHHRA